MGSAHSGLGLLCCAGDYGAPAAEVVRYPAPDESCPTMPATTLEHTSSTSAGETTADASPATRTDASWADLGTGVQSEADVIVEAALAEATRLMTVKEFDVRSAEALFVRTEEQLSGMADGERALQRLKASKIFNTVSQRVAQFDAAIEILHNEHMDNLFQNEYGSLDLCVSPDGHWFDYRLTVDIDAPLSAALATANEIDLMSEAQPMMSEAAYIGEHGAFSLRCILKLWVAFLHVELVLEIVRVRDKKFGYVLEVGTTEFSRQEWPVPNRGRGAVRPWVYVTNLLLPRGGGKTGCTLIQVNRVDCGFSVPHRILNILFRRMAVKFVDDLRASALMALETNSVWAARMEEDRDGLYGELRAIETAAESRQEACMKSKPGREIFERPERLRPPAMDTRPPASRR